MQQPLGRAAPLPPEERRRHLVQVTTELIRRTGAVPSTRAIAAEAAVAEGTVFRAFATKDELIEAVVAEAMCPIPHRLALAAIDPDLPLRERLLIATTLMATRFGQMFSVFVPLGRMGPPSHGDHPGCPEPGAALDQDAYRAQLVSLIGGDRETLRVDPEILVDALRYLAFAGTNTAISGGHVLTPDVIVDMVLDGVIDRRLTHQGDRSRSEPDAPPTPVDRATLGHPLDRFTDSELATYLPDPKREPSC